jgi:hypothetical protein
MITPRRGDIVEIDFLDHAEHENGARGNHPGLSFKLTGRLVCNARKALVVETWCYRDKKTPRDGNVVRYTIVKGAIQKCSILRRDREKAAKNRVVIKDGQPC